MRLFCAGRGVMLAAGLAVGLLGMESALRGEGVHSNVQGAGRMDGGEAGGVALVSAGQAIGLVGLNDASDCSTAVEGSSLRDHSDKTVAMATFTSLDSNWSCASLPAATDVRADTAATGSMGGMGLNGESLSPDSERLTAGSSLLMPATVEAAGGYSGGGAGGTFSMMQVAIVGAAGLGVMVLFMQWRK